MPPPNEKLSDIIAKLSDTLAAGQVSLEIARNYIADDCVIHEADSLPFSGDWYGPQGYVDLLTKITATFPNLKVEISDLVTNEVDLLAFAGRIMGDTNRGSFNVRLAELWRFRDGKAVEISAFWHDTKLVMDLYNG